jgi:hypothetical protein
MVKIMKRKPKPKVKVKVTRETMVDNREVRRRFQLWKEGKYPDATPFEIRILEQMLKDEKSKKRKKHA